MIIFAVFLIAAVVAYPVTDFIISDAIERSLPQNAENFDHVLIIYDGPFAVNDLNMTNILKDTDKKVLMYTPPVNISESDTMIHDSIISKIEATSSIDIVSEYILGKSDMKLGEILTAVMQSNRETLSLNDLANTSEVIIFQAIPYESNITETDILKNIGSEFENLTGREPMLTSTHLSRDGKTGEGSASVVYTKPLEVPLLKLKMSAIIAVIATLPILFYLAAKEIDKYVNLRKLNIKDRIPFKPIWVILIVAVMFISFILGAIYSYFFMAPLFIQFLYISAAASGAQATYSIYEFVNFISLMVLIFGFIFEFPLVIFILNRLGIVQKRMLTKYRRHAYVLFFILAAIITPPDVISQIIVAVPMIFFYELSVIIVRIFGRRDPPKTSLTY
jgi:Sec-independent protein secretion pathway component TatC